jgi:hypothetical protein
MPKNKKTKIGILSSTKKGNAVLSRDGLTGGRYCHRLRFKGRGKGFGVKKNAEGFYRDAKAPSDGTGSDGTGS